MKKTYLLVITITFIALVSASCGHQSEELSHEEPLYHNINPFFFPTGATEVLYYGEFDIAFTADREIVTLYINEIGSFGEGRIYELIIEPVVLTDRDFGIIVELGEDRRRLGYFYVTADGIYLVSMWGHEMPLDITDNEKMDRLISDARIVSAEYDVSSRTEPDAHGEFWHRYVEVDGDRRISRLYSSYVGGTRYWERIIWERGKGIVEYRSGFGAGRDLVGLTRIDDSLIIR